MMTNDKKNIKIKSQHGFTLIEVIVTVAIIGIVTVPIALIFQSALLSSIETRQQLIATQLSQQYVEKIKLMNMSEFNDLDGEVFDESGYDVAVTLLDLSDSSEFGQDSFKMPTLSSSSYGDADLIVVLEDSTSSETHVTFIKDDNSKEEDRMGNDASGDRNLNFDFHKTSPSDVKIQVDLGVESEFITKALKDQYIVYVYSNDTMASSSSTTITVDNATGKDVEIYVFETPADQIKPEIVLNTGNNTVYRNISEPKFFEYRIYAFEIRVSKDGEDLSKIVTTRLAQE
jgi:prepilin-type N-terminal cleavage/methylation domain-containing protein